MTGSRPLVIFVVGPTAAGKSAFALQAAEATQSEILNTDSIQIYQRVDIGAAKPTTAELARVPHHLVGVVPAGETWTVGDFRREAIRVITERFRAGTDVLFAVGGSGFYVQALEKGLVDVPEIAPEIRAAVERDVEEYGLAALHLELTQRDPESAAEISINDSYRIKRAIEIVRTLQGARILDRPAPDLTWSGLRRLHAENAKASLPFDVVKLGIIRPRPQIRKAVEARTHKMLELGLIDEVQGLRQDGFSNWAPMLSVGYREVQEMLDGHLGREELPSMIVTKTMQLVKRQTTWFRRDEHVEPLTPKRSDTNSAASMMGSNGTRWFDVDNGHQLPIDAAINLIKQWRAHR